MGRAAPPCKPENSTGPGVRVSGHVGTVCDVLKLHINVQAIRVVFAKRRKTASGRPAAVGVEKTDDPCQPSGEVGTSALLQRSQCRIRARDSSSMLTVTRALRLRQHDLRGVVGQGVCRRGQPFRLNWTGRRSLSGSSGRGLAYQSDCVVPERLIVQGAAVVNPKPLVSGRYGQSLTLEEHGAAESACALQCNPREQRRPAEKQSHSASLVAC